MKRFRRKSLPKVRHIELWLLGVLAFLTHRPWFNLDGGLLFNRDWKYRPDALMEHIGTGAYGMWVTLYGLGAANVQPYMFLPLYTWSFFDSYALAVRITYMIPIAVLSLLAPYLLVRYLTKDRLLAFLSAIMYGFSTYMLMRSTAHLPIALVNAITPLIMLTFIRLNRQPTPLHAVQFAILFFISCAVELRITFIVALILALYWVVLGNHAIFRKHYKVVALAAALILALNAYWIFTLPFISSSVSGVAERGLWGDHLFTMSHALSFSEYNWSGGEVVGDFQQKPIQAHAWLVPLMAIIAFIGYKRLKKPEEKKLILFFGILALTGIFLTKQSADPLPGVYAFLYQHVPGFQLFREASKFYLLTGIGYLGLFAFGFRQVLEYIEDTEASKYIRYAVVLCATGLLLINATPLISNEIGSLHEEKSVPFAYTEFDKLVEAQGSSFRTLWVPYNEQLGYFDTRHSKISLWTELSNNPLLREQFSPDGPGSSLKNPDTYFAFLESDFGKLQLAEWSVKYVVIPPEMPINYEKIFPDTGDRDALVRRMDSVSYLKKIKLGTKQIDVYENIMYKPPVSVPQSLVRTDSMSSAVSAMRVQPMNARSLTAFIIGDEDNQYYSSVVPLFDEPTYSRSANGLSVAERADVSGDTSDLRVFQSDGGSFLEVVATEKQVSLRGVTSPQIVLNNQQPVFSATPKNVMTYDLKPNARYLLRLDDSLIAIKNGLKQQLGDVSQLGRLELVNEGQNLITNGSFETGAWNSEVGNCFKRDDFPAIGMRMNTQQKTDGKQSLQLEATRHIACNFTTARVSQAQELVLSFDYQSDSTDQAGYFVRFDDLAQTTVTEKLSVTQPLSWQRLQKLIRVPKGAKTAQVYLYAYESDGVKNSVIRYDNVVLAKPETVRAIDNKELAPLYNELPFNLTGSQLNARVDATQYTGKNLIQNPSFEKGLWQQEVGDCNNYDNRPDIAMRADSDAGQGASLQLIARRHVACTTTEITLEGIGQHEFSLDLKGVKKSVGGYYIRFDDPQKTTVARKLPFKDEVQWRTIRERIAVPYMAKKATLFLYAYQPVGGTESIVWYDNVQFMGTPVSSDDFLVMRPADKKLSAPRSLSYAMVNGSTRLIRVQGAKDTFSLALHDNYDKGWRLRIVPKTSFDNCDLVGQEYEPPFSGASVVRECAQPQRLFGRQDFRPNKADKQSMEHFEVNGFANGWLVDVRQITAAYEESYFDRNEDGTFDFVLVAYYEPQSYLIVGLLITIVAFGGSLTYLIYSHRAQFIWWRKRKYRARH